LAATLLDRFGAEQVAQAFVTMWRSGRSSPEVLSDVATPGERPEPKPRAEFGASVWYTISVGHTGRAEARWLLPKICEAGGITKDGIGAIRVQTDMTYVQIGKDVAAKFGAGLALEEGVEMTRMDGEPVLDRPERPARAPRAEKPAYKAKLSRFVEDDAPLAERKPYTKREPAAAKPAGKPAWAADDGPAKGFEVREGEKPKRAPAKKPYAKKADGEKKPWVKREEGDGKPWEKRDAAPRKPYVKRGDAAEAAKPYAKREDGAKPYAPRGASPEAGGERKPRWKPEAGAPAKPRSAGFKSHGAGKPAAGADARPARSAGFKSHSGEGKSFGKPAGKPAGKPFAKPAKPKANPNDTSKRFVPPKKG